MKLKSNIHSVSLLVIKSTQHIFSFLINVRKNCYAVVMEMAKKIVVYDGPGLLSSKLQAKRGQFLCSTFQCFVQILLTSSRPFSYFAKRLKPYLELSVHNITNLTFKCKASPCFLLLSTQNISQLNVTITSMEYQGKTLDKVSCIYGGLVGVEQFGRKYQESVALCENYRFGHERSFDSSGSLMTILLYLYLNYCKINGTLIL